MKKSVLVTGASGALGPLLVAELLNAGYQVRALVRQIPETPIFDDAVQVVQGEITNRAEVEAAVRGVHLVFHLAAKLHITDPGLDQEASYFRINTYGTELIAKACEASGVERLVFFSTIAVYGETRGMEPLTETSPVNADTYYAKSKKQAEDIVLGARKRGDPASPIGVVLRVAAVYGSRMKGNYRTLFSAIRKGLFFPVGEGKNRRTLVFEADLVRASLIVARHPADFNQIFNVTDGAIHTLNEIVTAMYGAVGKKRPGLFLPVKPLWIATDLADRAVALAGVKRPSLKRRVEKYLEDVAVSGERLKQETGFQAAYTLEQGFQETVFKWNEAVQGNGRSIDRARRMKGA